MRERRFKPTRQPRISRGFSLIEVLIATALLGALLSSVFAFVENLTGARDATLDHADRTLAASTLIDRLEADIMTCLVGDSRNGAGVRGDESSIRILSRGVAAMLADRGLSDPDVLGDLQETEIRFDEASGRLEGRRRAVAPTGGAGDATFEPIGTLGYVRFRYHDGTSWRESFDSLQAGRLPVAIEVAVWYAPWPGGMNARDDADVADDLYDLDNFDRANPLTDDPLDADAEPRDALADAPEVPEPPDRIRVIAVLDADAGSDELAEEAP